MKFTPNADCKMVREAIQGNTTKIHAYNQEFIMDNYERVKKFKIALKVVIYTQEREKYKSNQFVEIVESPLEEVRINWKGKEY